MNKQINPNFVSAVLIGFTILILVVLPIRIEFGADEILAQETPTEVQAVAVAQAETSIAEFTLRTQLGGDPAMAFVGVGGEIDGVTNPELVVNMGDTVRITVINGDPTWHDLKIDAFGVDTGQMLEDEQTVIVEFVANQPGNFDYYCSVPGHREIGMKGLLRVVGTVAVGDESAMTESLADEGYGSGGIDVLTADPAIEDAVSIVRNPADLPAPLNNSGAPRHHIVDMKTIEVNGQLADGTTYRYMTFDGQVPGPMLRMTIGDTMELRLQNEIRLYR